MADADSNEFTQLQEEFYNDPEKLSQLLGQRVGPSSSFRFTSTTEETVASAVVAVPSSAQHHVAATSPRAAHDPTPRRAAINTRYVKPSLPKHHSAPTVTDVMEERSEAGRMYRSFNDGNGIGDTQPDSQIYKNWTSGLHATSVYDEGHGTSLLNRVEEEEDTTEDTPFIEPSPDVLQSPTITSPTVIHDDNNPETQPHANGALTSPLKFETPAMAGRKRDNQGEFLSSAMRTATTPGTALTATGFFPPDMLPAAGDGMSLTQIFNATQAVTSPIQGIMPDDPVFPQPSPKFANARQSSPLAAVSSPIPAPKIESALRRSSEPRTEYITMKQSQERRLRETEQQRDAPIEQDSWEEELTRLERQRALRKARERLEDEAAKTLTKVTAPSFSSPAQRKRGQKLGSLSATKKQTHSVSRSAARLSAYDGPFDDDELQGLAQTAAVNGNGIAADGESPKALPQVVPSSEPPTPANASNKGSSKVQVPRTSSHPQGTLSGRALDESPPGSLSVQIQEDSQYQKFASQRSRRVSQLRGGGGSFTVMDSQPGHPALSSVPRPTMTLPSSPSTNQYSINQTTLRGKTGFTSQVMSSSMPPMPPESSSPLSDGQGQDEEGPEAEDEAVRSSPPPVINDEFEDRNEIAYDEHNYEEHLSAGDEDESNESLPDTDVGMDEDKVVPESEHGNEAIENDEAEEMVVDSTVVPNIAAEERDEDIPETAEQDGASRNQVEDDEMVLSSYPEDTLYHRQTNGFTKPRLQRQSTIPESDMMEDTQPSFSPAAHAGHPNTVESSGLDDAMPIATAGTVLFHTAQEQPSWCGSDDRNPCDTESNDKAYYTAPVNSNVQGAPDENEIPQKAEPPLFLSLSDIANQPETQRSVDMSSIDFPSLFPEGTENELNTMTASGSSPLRPPAKKLKISHSGKRRRFISPAKTPERNPSPSPMGKVTDSPIQPSSNTQRGEEAGATAAETARAAVASAKLPSTSVSKTSTKKSARPQKKSALKTVGKEKILKMRPETTSTRRSMAAVAIAPDLEDEEIEMRSAVPAHDAALPSSTTAHGEEGDPVDSTPDAPSTAQPITEANNASDRGEEPTGPLTVPNRVFALWPGQGYYPATCLGYAGPNRVRIRYDEGTLNTLETVQVRGLELRKGDQVKVDQPGMKKNVYIVVGLKDKVTVDDGVETPPTDCRGYRTVVLEVKNRESLPAVQHAEQPTVVTAPVERIYLTNQLCGKFRDRLYNINISPPQSPSVSTPTVPAPGAAPLMESPSLSRRGLAGPSLLREGLRAGSVASSYQGGGGTVFVNMAFAITLQHDEDDLEKHALAKLAISNGGQVLDSFSELFNDIEDAEMGPSRPSSADKGNSTSTERLSSSHLGLRQECKGLRFAALITDTHSRRSKYVQALALNIPCLHHRWLTDSIAASRPLPFAKYMLPAGVSTFLDPAGVVRSRNIRVYDPASSNLEEVIQKREVLLQNQSVLLITGKSKRDAERKKPYLFLTHALGPRIVGPCPDIATAKTMIQDGKWNWVYVDGGEAGLVDAEQALFGYAKSAGSVKSSAVERKKRKRDHSTEPEVLIRVGEVAGKKVRLVCDEFVIQSLILGALVEE